jgi:tetratricopeptide (TPR) repeat protein
MLRMKKFLVVFFLVQSIFVFAQQSKKVESALKTFNSGKIDDGIKKMETATQEDPSEDNWDLLVQMYKYRYEYAEQQQEDALTLLLLQSLGGSKAKIKKYTSPSVCYRDLIEKSKQAELNSRSTTASMVLRAYLVDYYPDTAVADTAKKEFNSAEKYFSEKDYPNAKLHYQNACKLDPSYYKALIYLGDTHWHMKKMDSAIYYFKQGIQMHGDLLEPRKYLVDALRDSKQYDEAIQESINAITVYPDESMFEKVESLYAKTGRTFDRHWIKRGCNVNTYAGTQLVTTNETWKAYQQARGEIKTYCDTNGVIVKSNSLTKAHYMEVYSWEKMLASNLVVPQELAFAKKMADEGYLDCYVFISLYHYDEYDQFIDFAKNNKERIRTYITKYLIQ